MYTLSLKILGLIAFLGSSPTHSFIYGGLKFFIRIFILFYLPLFFTSLFAFFCTKTIDREEMLDDVKRMVYQGETNTYRDLSDISELTKGDDIYIGAWGLNNNQSVVIGIGFEKKPKKPSDDHDPCQKKGGIHNGYLCILHINPVFKEDHKIFKILPIVSTSLKTVSFPNSSYAIGDFIIELIESSEDSPKISQRKKDKIKYILENSLGSLFIPESKSIVMARRLNGTIQYATYFASFLALLLLFQLYLENIIPNKIIRKIKTITLTKDQINEASLPFENHQNKTEIEESLENEDINADLVNEGISAIHATNITYNTPWHGDNHFNSYHQANSFYVAVSDYIRHKGSFLGAQIDAPVLRFRRVAAHAVENTEDTSIVPTFLEIQKESMLAKSDGNSSLIRFLIWAIPTIGFIGTVIGISEALTGTLSLQSSRDFVASAAQGNVSSLMGMAFDTTLVALFAAFIVMLLYHLYLSAEADLIVRERDDTEEEVMRTVRVHDKNDEASTVSSAVLSMKHTLPILNQTIKSLHSSIELMQNSPLNQNKGANKGNSIILIINIILLLIIAWTYKSEIMNLISLVFNKLEI